MSYRLLADLTTAAHAAYVACVVFGLLLTILGKLFGWQWVTNRWFRSIHLAMIALVVLRTIVWPECPLTWWERDLRTLAGQINDEGEINFEGSPVGEVLHHLIHPDLPLSVFPPVYAAFGLLIVATLWFVPVNWRGVTCTPAKTRSDPPTPASSVPCPDPPA
jgi:hypothetical protein